MAVWIERLAGEVSNINEVPTDVLERVKVDLEKAESESRLVKEALREATKLFKAEGLNPPGKDDRQTVEKQYTNIKENLSK